MFSFIMWNTFYNLENPGLNFTLKENTEGHYLKEFVIVDYFVNCQTPNSKLATHMTELRKQNKS